MNNLLSDQTGVLTFEWILLISILVIGIIGGISAVRDSLTSEMEDVSAAVLSLDGSFSYPTVQTDISYNDLDGNLIEDTGASVATGSVTK